MSKPLPALLLVLGLTLAIHGPALAEAPLPTHVVATLAEARKDPATFWGALVVASRDPAGREAALRALATLEGARIRSDRVIWVPEAGDPLLAELLEAAGLRSLPAVLLLDREGRRVARHRLGAEAEPVLEALAALAAPPPLDREELARWLGAGQDPAPCLAYGEARAQDPWAARKEPHRTWLAGLLRSGNPDVQRWAATRLVEADAPARAGEEKPMGRVLRAFGSRLREVVQEGNQAKAPASPPWEALGRADALDEGAPCWEVWRQDLRSMAPPRVTLGIYAVMAPRIVAGDRDWILAAFRVAAGEATLFDDPLSSVAFWLATDWLVVHGERADWDAFQAPCRASAWKRELAAMRKALERVPEAWDGAASLQDTFCGGLAEDAFWAQPDACLASWGITREQLAERSMTSLKIRFQPKPPSYPEALRTHRLATTVEVGVVADATGKVRWVRPRPGYLAGIVAPTALRYAAAWSFHPGLVGGVPRPTRFTLTMPFMLR